MRSSDAPLLVVPRIHTEMAHFAFSVAAPSTWNCLPADIRLCENTHFQTPLENPSIQTHLVLLCCIKHLCIFGTKGAIQIYYYYYYYYYYYRMHETQNIVSKMVLRTHYSAESLSWYSRERRKHA